MSKRPINPNQADHRHRYNLPPGYQNRRCLKCQRRETEIKLDRRLRRRGIVTQQARMDAIHQQFKKRGLSGLVDMALLYRNDVTGELHTELMMGAACYYRLEYITGKRTNLAFMDRTWYSNSALNPKFRDWAHWWMNDGPYADAFLTKDIKELPTGVWYDVKQPASYVVGAGIGLRYMREYPHYVETWNVFKDYTWPEVAWIISEAGRPTFNAGKFMNFRINGRPGTGHSILQSGYYRAEIFNNIINHRFDPEYVKRLEPMSKRTKYSPLNQIWGRSIIVEPKWPDVGTQVVKDSFGREIKVHGLGSDPAQLKEFFDGFIEINQLRKESACPTSLS